MTQGVAEDVGHPGQGSTSMPTDDVSMADGIPGDAAAAAVIVVTFAAQEEWELYWAEWQDEEVVARTDLSFPPGRPGRPGRWLGCRSNTGVVGLVTDHPGVCLLTAR